MDTKQGQSESMRPHLDYFKRWIVRIAAGASVEISHSTAEIYLDRLRTKLSGSQMATAGQRTIDEWTEPHKMPPVAFILERAEARAENLPTVQEIRAGYEGGKSPQQFLADLATKHGGITREEVAGWLAGGKESYWRHYGEQMLNDPVWWAGEQKRLRLPGNKDRLAEVVTRGWLPGAPVTYGLRQPTPQASDAPQRGSQGAKPGDWARGREPGEEG